MKVVCPKSAYVANKEDVTFKVIYLQIVNKTCPVLIFLLFHHSVIIILRFSLAQHA